MLLKTGKPEIILRQLEPEDIYNLYSWTNKPEIASFFVFSRLPGSIEKTKKFLNSQLEGDPNNIHLVIEKLEPKEFIGVISLKNINWIDRNAEYAIVITDKKNMGKGYAKAASLAILKYAFLTINLERVYLNVLSTNSRAINFYERIGFRKEGILRRHVFKEGEYVDLLWYGILKNEFLKLLVNEL